MSRLEQFQTLLTNFIDAVPNIFAVIISDMDGLVIANKGNPEFDEDISGALTVSLQPILDQIREQFAFKKSFGTASFDTEDYSLIFVDTTRNAIVNVVMDLMGSIDKTLPYVYLLAEKVALILEGNAETQTEIPRIGFNLPEDETAEIREKNQFYPKDIKPGRFFFKTLILGDAGVGKTSLMMRFAEDRFQEDYRATIGLNMLVHTMTLLSRGNTSVNFSIWDIGSQKYFQRVRPTYYQGAKCAFLVFDITSRESFENLTTWRDELVAQVGNVPYFIVGNKTDLEGQRAVPESEGQALAREWNTSYLETSAKTGENVTDAFRLMAYHLVPE